MTEQPGFFDFDPEAFFRFDPDHKARRTDPWTSHEAAESLEPKRIRLRQQAVEDHLRAHGPQDDTTLAATYQGIPQSASGLRTRRKELVDMGRVAPVGETVLASGRKAIVWGVVS